MNRKVSIAEKFPHKLWDLIVVGAEGGEADLLAELGKADGGEFILVTAFYSLAINPQKLTLSQQTKACGQAARGSSQAATKPCLGFASDSLHLGCVERVRRVSNVPGMDFKVTEPTS